MRNQSVGMDARGVLKDMTGTLAYTESRRILTQGKLPQVYKKWHQVRLQFSSLNYPSLMTGMVTTQVVTGKSSFSDR